MPAPGIATAPAIHRIEVFFRPGTEDARARALERDAAALGIRATSVRSAKVYLIEAPLSRDQVELVRTRLLVNPVVEESFLGASPALPGSRIVEIHPLPGVMDPAAQTVRQAVEDLTGAAVHGVSTGDRFDIAGIDPAAADRLAAALLANPVIQKVHHEPFHPAALPHGAPYSFRLTHIPLRDLTDAALEKLSRDAHLFLDLHEMRAIRDYYKEAGREPTDIELETLAQTWSEHCVHKTLKSNITYRTATASATKRQAPSAKHDPLKFENRPGHTLNPDGSVTIHNLLKSTVAAATHELIEGGLDWALSVFKDNAGVIAFDDTWAINVKVETHNHPSAIEPYGGAATGIGGCIRDVIGTGLGAKPIANTDVFCVAMPDNWTEPGDSRANEPRAQATGLSTTDARAPAGTTALTEETHRSRSGLVKTLPKGVIHPRRVLSRVVAGVRDYGNRMGIPTVSGAVAFDDRYIGNPLVFCGCVGLMPRDRIFGKARPGDLIVALGGRTGRDGIHGATFSSAELTDTHADEFSHAVQIGNAIEEKRVLDAILRARDFTNDPASPNEPRAQATGLQASATAARTPSPLYSGLTDCGAGGFSSAVGEMGADIGATVHLDKAPLKYAGLSYTEVWISEAQERMVLAVPRENLQALQHICDEERVEVAVLGEFGTESAELILNYKDHATSKTHEVGRLSMHFLHEGIPTPTREAVWKAPVWNEPRAQATGFQPIATRTLTDALLSLLAHPNISSKRWIIRQYDHEVQGNTLIKPLVGAAGQGPSDASVISPVAGSKRAIAISQGLATGIGDPALPGGGGDPYLMTLAAVDECVRNLVCVGADPERIAILDNFCWPSCKKPENLASLVRAAEGCYDAAKAYRTPFVSGKDSLNNQFTTEDGRTIEIPPTLLITGVGIVHDRAKCITSDMKRAGSILVLVGPTTNALGGSHFASIVDALPTSPIVSMGEARRGLHASLPPYSASNEQAAPHVPVTDLAQSPKTARAIAQAIAQSLILSAHDLSDGGLACAAAEMLIGAHDPAHTPTLGAELHLEKLPWQGPAADPFTACFAETPGRYLLEVAKENIPALHKLIKDIPHAILGATNDSGRLTIPAADVNEPVANLFQAWTKTLDW